VRTTKKHWLFGISSFVIALGFISPASAAAPICGDPELKAIVGELNSMLKKNQQKARFYSGVATINEDEYRGPNEDIADAVESGNDSGNNEAPIGEIASRRFFEGNWKLRSASNLAAFSLEPFKNGIELSQKVLRNRYDSKFQSTLDVRSRDLVPTRGRYLIERATAFKRFHEKTSNAIWRILATFKSACPKPAGTSAPNRQVGVTGSPSTGGAGSAE